MPNESGLWAGLKKAVDRHGGHDIQRIENSLAAGVPDVNGFYTLGGFEYWVELKDIDAWPKRKTTIFRIHHYTGPQRSWLLTRGRAGGRCGLMFRVDQKVYMCRWDVAQVVGTLTREETLRFVYDITDDLTRFVDFV